ncbi:MAG: DUF4388 domain-containing protein [Deltaproteobacteria bacterium]|nr:DUF4388 domain-containing protein [Deltaproteobacteria bacterium]
MNIEISGDIEETRCPEIIKILSLGNRTGRLSLNNGGVAGSIFFDDGKVIHASCGPIKGVKAIYEMAAWTSGEYTFFVDDTPDLTTIDMPVDEILSEAADRTRQMDRITSLIPSSGVVYTLDPDINEKEITLKFIQWRVLAHTDGTKSIADIAQTLGLTVFDTMKVFYTLLKMGIIKEVPQGGPENKKMALHLPQTPFIETLVKALTNAIGPIAPLIIAETAQDTDINLTTDDVEGLASLIEMLSSKIPEETMSLKFLDTMTDWLKLEGRNR